jgi:hypothetical protein
VDVADCHETKLLKPQKLQIPQHYSRLRQTGGRQSKSSKKQSRNPSCHAVLTGDARRPPSRLEVFDNGNSDTADGNRLLSTHSVTGRELAHGSNSSGHANRDTPVQDAAVGPITDSISLALKRKKRKASPARHQKSRYNPYDRRGRRSAPSRSVRGRHRFRSSEPSVPDDADDYDEYPRK